MRQRSGPLLAALILSVLLNFFFAAKGPRVVQVETPECERVEFANSYTKALIELNKGNQVALEACMSLSNQCSDHLTAASAVKVAK